VTGSECVPGAKDGTAEVGVGLEAVRGGPDAAPRLDADGDSSTGGTHADAPGDLGPSPTADSRPNAGDWGASSRADSRADAGDPVRVGDLRTS
jgi:hypothetical protein